MHSPLAIANEFILRAEHAGKQLTHMQLQKLVYLAHGWGLAVTGDPLIEDEFEAGISAPSIDGFIKLSVSMDPVL
jgi:uncharacterized phage-associated protein